jgi:uncharacterized Zn finger protein
MKRKGYAPGWQLRCPKCGGTWDAAESGVIRIKAASWRKRVLLRCVKCGSLQFLILEKRKDMDART